MCLVNNSLTQSKNLKWMLCIAFIFFIGNAFCNVKITGDLTERKSVTEVAIFLPVGNHTNDELETRYPVINNKFTVDLNVTESLFIKILIGARKIYLLIEPGDNIQFKYFDTGDTDSILKFTGSNAAGQHWYNVYCYQPLNNYIGHGTLLTAISTGSKGASLNALSRFIHKETRPLDLLYKRGQIDKAFWALAKTDMRSMHALNMVRKITDLEERISDRSLIAKYKLIVNALNRFAAPGKIENTRGYFGCMFLGNYYSDTLNNKGKVNMYQLGPYNGYQFAPDSIKSFLLGDILLFQQDFGSDEFEFKNAFALYKKEFPRSAYIAVLNSLNKTATGTGTDGNILIDTVAKYTNIDELKQHFKGKTIYIDLWATWCVPCRAEFPYYQSLSATLKKMGVQSVFVSIDEPKAGAQWKKLVKQNHLEGYHILAGTNLKADLVKLVYKKGQISVPRYLIINKQGQIVNWDAPRPSNTDLINVLSKL
jgi:thiol-disulfide isomerase/thioredoxin